MLAESEHESDATVAQAPGPTQLSFGSAAGSRESGQPERRAGRSSLGFDLLFNGFTSGQSLKVRLRLAVAELDLL